MTKDEPGTRALVSPPLSEALLSRRDIQTAVPWVLAAAAVVARLAFMRSAYCTHEDALITLRYAENLAHGLGFVYNPGERVLGTTTPLYTLFLAAVARVGGPAMLAGKLANILADGVTTWLLVRLAGVLQHPRAGWLAGLLYAFAFTSVYFSVGGMETSLVTLAGVAAVYCYLVRRPRAMGLALGLLFLLRIDGLALAIALLLGWAWRERRPPWRTLMVSAAVALPWVAAATIYFGSPVPTSAVAKLVVYDRMRPGFLLNLPDFVHQFWGGAAQKLILVCALAGVFMAWRRLPSLRPVVLWMLVYHGAMLASHAPVGAFGWYFAPPLPAFLLLASLGVHSLARGATAIRGRAFRPVPDAAVLACLSVCLIGLSLHLRSGAREAADSQRLVEDALRRPLGAWLREVSTPDERVMLEPIGYIGYYSRRPVLDIVGLVSPEVLRSYRPEVANPLGDIVTRFHPALLVLRADERQSIETYERTTGRPILATDYGLLRTFSGADGGPAFWVYRRVASALPSAPGRGRETRR